MSSRQSSASRRASTSSKYQSGKKRQWCSIADRRSASGYASARARHCASRSSPCSGSPSVRLLLGDGRVPGLDGDAADLELEQAGRDRHGVVAADGLPQRLEPSLGRSVVDVEQEVDVGVLVRVAPGARAGEERGAERAEPARGGHDLSGHRAAVLGRPVHPGRIVDSPG
jgi:hypothetical protein